LLNIIGDFLDPSSPQLPSFASTIALVYNTKPEASLLSSSKNDSASEPSSPSASPSVIDHGQRTNDVYAEWDTMDTVHAVRDAIAERYPVELIEANEDAYERLRRLRPGFVFNIAEGLQGVSREAQIPALLELLDIPYLGSDPLTLATCLDKARTKEILAYHRIPTAPFVTIASMEEFEDARVRFPSMVKPLHEGSSKGIYNSCVVRNTIELEREVRTVIDTYKEPALVEEFLSGREFTVAIMGNNRNLTVLPIVEIKFDALPAGMNPIYSYEAKWVWDTSDNPLEIFECPARLSPGLQERIIDVCTRAYRVLRCRDWARIDVRLDSRESPCILELNPLPGILPRPEDNSCFPKAARAAGMSYQQLINGVLEIALARCGFVPHPQLSPTLEQS
jgi:D-alanine-D-alanine ligase